MPHIYLVSIDLQTYLNQHIDHKMLELLRLEKTLSPTINQIIFMFLLASKRRDTLIILLLQNKKTFRVIKSNSFELWDHTFSNWQKSTLVLQSICPIKSHFCLPGYLHPFIFVSVWPFSLKSSFHFLFFFSFSDPLSFPLPARRKYHRPSLPIGSAALPSLCSLI